MTLQNIETATKNELTQTQSDDNHFLTFTLSSEMFAIGILNIKEILEYGNLTTVPMMPSFVRGVINLRGAVVPVIDLSARFSNKQSEVTKRTCIVIIEVTSDDECHVIGVMVDAVSAVLEIPAHDIEPPPALGAKIRTDFIHGMGKVDGDFVIILNVDKVLSVDELGMLNQNTELKNMEQ
jgi:purine-binding chemotaxis protein CheW